MEVSLMICKTPCVALIIPVLMDYRLNNDLETREAI